jgi:2-polyprenyl-3-methyl-5-hydroxy-6-metoxy-1,4-benzoquinol methylase
MTVTDPIPASPSPTPVPDDAAGALADRLVTAATGALELFGVYLGDRLGLYACLAGGDGHTPGALAADAGIAERYAREWLEQQAVAGFLAVDDPAADAAQRVYRLPAAHAGVLADPTDADHVAPFGRMLAGIAGVLDEVVAAYRNGTGVPYVRYGADFRAGQGAMNRPAFTTALVDEWIPAVPGLAARLARGGKVADLGCGQGWSTVSVARAFPAADVLGVDADVPSIEDARSLARAAGVAARFEAVDAAELVAHGPFDVVLLLEALHDLARPTEVLAAARAALTDDGCVLVADEKVAGAFHAPGDEMDRLMYGFSIVHCLPASMAEQPSAALGTVLREPVVRDLAREAGFRSVEVLPVDAGFFRLYCLWV